MKRIILITGGQRSGKSAYAERLALALSSNPVYVATAHIWDEEFRERVQRHQQRRGPEWTNIEEERHLSRIAVDGRVVLVDCCTLWATNYIATSASGDELPDIDAILAKMQTEFDLFTQQEATFIFVTNEIGLGGTSPNALQRRFTDLLGWLNQYIAARADEVTLMVSGIPVRVKSNHTITPPGSPSPNRGRAGEGAFIHSIQHKIDNLNKPKGSLGVLEEVAMQVALIQGTLTPELRHPAHILFGGDHGIEREGVSLSPREVTWQQMINYGRGGGGVNVLCRQHGFSLRIVDMGVDFDFDPVAHAHVIPRKIGHGTRNFLYEPAMKANEWARALAVGREQVDACFAEGCNIISFGEMGIGNTSPSSVLMHLFLDIPLAQCVGAGSGLDSEGVRHKLDVLTRAVEHFRASASAPSVADTIRYFVGYEMAAAIGAMLRAAELRMVILVDGFIMTACMLAAQHLEPSVRECAIFGHCGDEGGHRLMLDAMGAKPLLHLGMRLGEGTGALCAYPIVASAIHLLNEMDNFSHAQITKYF